MYYSSITIEMKVHGPPGHETLMAWVLLRYTTLTINRLCKQTEVVYIFNIDWPTSTFNGFHPGPYYYLIGTNFWSLVREGVKSGF